MKTLKKIAEVCGAFVVGGSLAALAFVGVQENLEFPTVDEIIASDNITQGVPLADQLAIKRSRQSTVRVLSLSEKTGQMASSTGTYVTAKGKYYILTVLHGIVGPCEATKIWIADGFRNCEELVHADMGVDYAFIRVEEIEELKPIQIPTALPQGRQWKKALATQTKAYYTGYPNNTGPLTFGGRVVGYTNEDFIYFHSYAWGGSSGAGVFTANGDFVGYVLAIDMGQTEFGISVLENIVIVVPAFKIDWATILD